MIDTHAHLDFSQFDGDRGEVIRRAFSSGVKKIINVGCNIERARASVELAEKYENIYAAVGIHPTDVSCFCHPEERMERSGMSDEGSLRYKIKEIEGIREIAKNSKVIAIGEIGLDYFRIDRDVETLQCNVSTIKNRQKQFFIAQLELARELGLPVIIHCRPSGQTGDAYEDLLEICSDRSRPVTTITKGVIHCFSGNREQAKQFLDLGFYISFTGNITYDKKGDSELTKVVRDVPLDKIMVETDCPFLAPVSTRPSIRGGPAPIRARLDFESKRGKRNEPMFVKYVAEKIAEIKGISLDEVEKTTDDNAGRLFELKTKEMHSRKS